MLTLGSTLFTGAILATALVALLFRRPVPPRWTRPDMVAMLVAVPIAGVMALGLGYMLTGIYQLTSDQALYQILPAILVWLAAFALWRLLGARGRLRAYAAAAPATGAPVIRAAPAPDPAPGTGLDRAHDLPHRHAA